MARLGAACDDCRPAARRCRFLSRFPVLLILLAWGSPLLLPALTHAVPPPDGRQTLARLDLNTALRVEAALVRTQLPPTFTVRVSSPFVVASDLPPAELDRVIAQTLQAAVKAMTGSLFRKPPPFPVHTYLFASRNSLAVVSRILWKDDTPPVYGYSRKDLRMMVMDITTGGGTLIHELTHVMLWTDFPTIPNWFNEGISSLHEAVRLHPDRLEGMPNWRGAILEAARRKQRLRSLAELVSDPDFYGKDVEINYAHARYFCLFLQDRCDLVRFYERMKATPPKTAPAMALTHAAAACSLPESRLEREFQGYLQKALAP